MIKINKKVFEPIDKEERDMMESLDREEWTSVKNIKQEKEKALMAARDTLEKPKRCKSRGCRRSETARVKPY
jgi:hypothetical protein